MVDAGNRSVGRDDDHVKLVDAPELARLGLGGTGHSGKLVIHTEVVLKSDGRECLRRRLDFHVLLRLDGLMESVAPAASLHYTAGLLIDNLDLSVFRDYVIDIQLEHRICLQKLDDSVHALALEGEVRHQLILLLTLLGRVGSRLLNLGNRRTHVRKDEEIVIADSLRKYIASLVGHVDRVLLLVDDEVERVCDVRHLTLIVLHVVVLHLLEKLLHAGFTEELDERTVFRIAFVRTEQQNSAILFVSVGDELLRLVQYSRDQRFLLAVEILDIRLVLRELLVVPPFHRSGDDERGSRVVDEH